MEAEEEAGMTDFQFKKIIQLILSQALEVVREEGRTAGQIDVSRLEKKFDKLSVKLTGETISDIDEDID